jgi:hypothetical protein
MRTKANSAGFTLQQLPSLSPEPVFHLEGATTAIRTGSNSLQVKIIFFITVSVRYTWQQPSRLPETSMSTFGYSFGSQNLFEVRNMYLAATTTATRTGLLTFLRLGWSNSVDTTPSRIPDTGK